VASVDEQAVELVLQNPPHRLPEHAGCLHHDLLDAERSQPIPQRQQPRDRRRELRHALLTRAALSRHPHTRDHLLLMHIKRRGALYHRFHLHSINAIDETVAQGPLT